jgi:hypothetical protein
MARDARTGDDPTTPPEVLAEAETHVGIGEMRTIEDIAFTPPRESSAKLIGSRGGGHLRGVLEEVLPGEREAGTPLYLLLDDISGTSLIAGFGWSRWTADWMQSPAARPVSDDDHPVIPVPQRRSPEGVCIGFAPGSRALDEDGRSIFSHRTQPVGPLVHPDDPYGWHALPDLPDVSMRRARRIDVWIDGDVVHIDAAFQDSAGDPDHYRVAVHEYGITATADVATMTLQSVTPDPRILPYLECPGAVDTASRLIGTRMADLRMTVLERLAKTNGCTHLNDALRALAEVPVLASHLR